MAIIEKSLGTITLTYMSNGRRKRWKVGLTEAGGACRVELKVEIVKINTWIFRRFRFNFLGIC